ncbi:MAG: DMT family transporter [Gammaproteobacteria bacterium]|nr:DMT family transporter [Gammaproteobacteria bacterium]
MSVSVHGRHNKPLTGAFLAFLSMSFFSCQDALIKLLAADYSLFQILFVRSIVIVIPLFVLLVFRGGKQAFYTSRCGDHAVRVLYNFMAFMSYYFAITRLPLGQVTAIALSAPLVMTALSGPLLGEHADGRKKLILAIGFIGVLLIVRPEASPVDWTGTGAALAGAFMFALLGIQTRKMSATEPTELMVFFSGLTFLMITGAIMLNQWVTPSLQDTAMLVGIGVVSLIAQLLIVHSYQFAAVYVIAPFEYVTILWAILLGLFVFSEAPTPLMLTGSVLIIGCGLVIVHLERPQAPPEKVVH